MHLTSSSSHIKLFAFELATKETEPSLTFEMFPNGLCEREIGSAVFLAQPTQTQAALHERFDMTMLVAPQHKRIHVLQTARGLHVASHTLRMPYFVLPLFSDEGKPCAYTSDEMSVSMLPSVR